MNLEEAMFFDQLPGTLPLYEALEARLAEAFPQMTKKVGKSQISFCNRYGFGAVSLPIRKKKGWPEVCILVTFGLGYQVENPRIVLSAEPYPNRWTHHVIVSSIGDIDDKLMGWMEEAYHFSMTK